MVPKEMNRNAGFSDLSLRIGGLTNHNGRLTIEKRDLRRFNRWTMDMIWTCLSTVGYPSSLIKLPDCIDYIYLRNFQIFSCFIYFGVAVCGCSDIYSTRALNHVQTCHSIYVYSIEEKKGLPYNYLFTQLETVARLWPAWCNGSAIAGSRTKKGPSHGRKVLQ